MNTVKTGLVPYGIDILKKLGTLLASRRLWFTVATIVVSLTVVYNALAVPFGLDAIPEPDTDAITDDIMQYTTTLAGIIRAVLEVLAIIVPSGIFVYAQSKRPSNNRDYY